MRIISRAFVGGPRSIPGGNRPRPRTLDRETNLAAAPLKQEDHLAETKHTVCGYLNVWCVVAWAVLLFVLTLLGGLPLFLGGLNLSRISSSTPHLPLILAGMLVSACAPTLAALFVAGLYPGAGGVRSVLRQVRTWRVGIVWYALAVIGPIILFLVVDVIHIALGGAPPVHWLAFRLLSGFGPGSMFWVVFGSLFAEELGWRGFAQPRLQDRFGALRASIVIGVLWATWHLWPVITPGGLSLETPEDATATYIRMISTAIVYAWMYNSTNGSLFLVMVAHFGHNFAGSVVQTPSDRSHFHLTIALLYLAVAVGIVLTTDSRTLTRVNHRRPAALVDRSPETHTGN